MKKVAFLCLALGAVAANAQTFSNPASIALPPVGTGGSVTSDSTAMSQITVSGIGTGATALSIDLFNMSHTFPDDLDFLLVNPSGVGVVFLSDAGGGTDIVGINLNFADSNSGQTSDAGPMVGGAFTVSNFVTGDTFHDSTNALVTWTDSTTINGLLAGNADGVWTLWVRDDASADIGSIAGGWALNFTAVPEPGTMALLGLGVAALAARKRNKK